MSHESKAGSRENLWERMPVMLLMALVLVAAGLLSAITAMRFAIRGEEVAVPDLAGVLEADAERLLAERGLGLFVDGRRFSDTVAEGHVLDQNPPADVRVKRERRVRVRISLGERQYAVPPVEGSSLRSTQMILSQRGLSVGNTLYAHTDAGEASTVVFQMPEPGNTDGDDPAVSVLVSLGSIDQYFVMPRLTGRTARDVTGRIRSEGFRLGEIVYREEPAVESGRVIRQQPPAGSRISKNDIILLEVSQ